MYCSRLFLLRLCVCTSLFLYLVYFFLPYLHVDLYSEEILRYLYYPPIETIIGSLGWVPWALLSMYFVAACMVFFEIIYARIFYLISLLIGIVVSYFSGIVSFIGVEIILTYFISMLDGVIVFVLFFNDPRRGVKN